MANVSTWSVTAASNNAAPPDGWPEGQAPSTVNDCAREMMAALRRQFQDAEWFDWGHTPTRTSATTFTVPLDASSVYLVNRRMKFYDATTLYGIVSDSTVSAAVTTVTVSLDSGSLTSSLTAAAVSIITPNNIAVPPTGDFRSIQVFTSSGTWNKPAGISKAYVQIVGGGGGSGGCAATSAGQAAESGGGGGGGYSAKLIDVSSISSVSVTIGAGGTAGTAGGNNGGGGGTTSFGAHCSATGGSGGEAGFNGTSGIAFGGNAGSGSGGDFNFTGDYGGNGRIVDSAVHASGFGGGAFFSGIIKMIGPASALAGLNYGGGAAGTYIGASTSATAGAAGASGLCVVMEFA